MLLGIIAAQAAALAVIEAAAEANRPIGGNYLPPDHRANRQQKARCRCINWKDDDVCCLLRPNVLAMTSTDPRTRPE